MSSSPFAAITLFSYKSGTTSAIVPTQDKIRSSSLSFSLLLFSKSADASLYATPAPASSDTFLISGTVNFSFRESGAFGFIIAYASGKISGALWWSVKMTSTPKLFKREISFSFEMPQSTVIITFGFFFAMYGKINLLFIP